MNEHPDRTPMSSTTFDDENKVAEEYLASGDLVAAARILVKIVGNDPGNFRAFNNMGIISWVQGAWQDAYDMFVKSVSLKPDYADALVNLLDAALKLKRIAMVTPLYRKALEISPDLKEIADILENIETQGPDIYTTERALMIGVYNPQIEEANALVKKGDYIGAMERYLRIIDTYGPDADAFFGLAIVSMEQERWEDAYTLFVESIKLNPVNKDAYFQLLSAARRCNREQDARSIFTLYAKHASSLAGMADLFEKV